MPASDAASRPNARKGGLFQGWLIVIAAALGICLGFVGTTIYAISSFTLPLSDEFGWSRSAISMGMTLVYITTIVALPIIGVLIDTYGVRKPLLWSTFFFGAILCLFYFLNSNIMLFYVGMVLLALLGAGTQSVSYVRLIVAWFDRRKGLALALGVSGAGLGALVLPPLVGYIIKHGGWRDAFLTLGLLNLLLVLPVLLLLVRNSPADTGSYPDGLAPPQGHSGSPHSIQQSGFQFGECIRTGTFWKLAVATLLLGISLNGTVSQMVPLLVDRGVARAHAGNLAALLGLSIIVARLIAGHLLDRFHAPFVAALLLLCPVIGYFSLAFLPGEAVAAFTLVAIGIGMGLEFDALGYFCAHYFGRVALGRIYSTLFVLFSAGGAAGSFFAGYSYDATHSYTTLLITAGIASFAAVLLTATLGRGQEIANADSPGAQTAH